jgi:hypothetical protein
VQGVARAIEVNGQNQPRLFIFLRRRDPFIDRDRPLGCPLLSSLFSLDLPVAFVCYGSTLIVQFTGTGSARI